MTTKDEMEIQCPCGCIAVWDVWSKKSGSPANPGYNFKRIGRMCLEHYKVFKRTRNGMNFDLQNGS